MAVDPFLCHAQIMDADLITIQGHLKGHLDHIAGEIGSRSLSEPTSLARARTYVEDRFREYGYTLHTQEFEAHGTGTANVTAARPDWNPSGPTLLLGAHYDTVRGTPGADDNASGVAVMLEVARLMSCSEDHERPQVVFTAFSAEEPPAFSTGVMGSRIFTDSLERMGWNIRGALVLEMVGFFRSEPGSQHIPLSLRFLGFSNRGDFIAVIGNGISRRLVRTVAAGIRHWGQGLPVEKLTIPGSGYLIPEARLSDNASFWDAGIPAVMITDTSFFRNPNYHRHTDRVSTLDMVSMSRLTRGLQRWLETGSAKGL